MSEYAYINLTRVSHKSCLSMNSRSAYYNECKVFPPSAGWFAVENVRLHLLLLPQTDVILTSSLSGTLQYSTY